MKYRIIVKNKNKSKLIKWIKYKPIKFGYTYFIDFEDNEKTKVLFRPTQLGEFEGIKCSKINKYINGEEAISFFKSLVNTDIMLNIMYIKQRSVDWNRLNNELTENEYW